MTLEDVTHESKFLGSFVPSLGLVGDIDSDWLVYVLRCRPQILGGSFTWYVGLVPADEDAVTQRMIGHKAGTAAGFTAANPPIHVELIHHVANPAAEAYVFFALMSKLPEGAKLDCGTHRAPTLTFVSCASRKKESMYEQAQSTWCLVRASRVDWD